jgi:hypothetical protein
LIEDSVDSFVPISAPTWALNALCIGLYSCITRMVIFSGRMPLVHILSFIFSGSLPSYFPLTMKCFKAYEQQMPNFRKELKFFAFWALLLMHHNGKPGFDYIMYIFILLLYHTFLGDWSYDYTRLSCGSFTLNSNKKLSKIIRPLFNQNIH